MFFHRLGPVQARKLLLTGDIVEASRRSSISASSPRPATKKWSPPAPGTGPKVGRMPADGVTIAKEAFRDGRAEPGVPGREEVASYLFHAYATNRSSPRASSTSFKTRAQHGHQGVPVALTNTSISTSGTALTDLTDPARNLDTSLAIRI